MFKTLFMCIFLTIVSLYGEDSPEEIRLEAQEKLESGFVKSAMGAIEVAGGIWRATRGDVLGAVAGTIDGSGRIGEAIDDFKEAKQLFDQARDIERQYEFNEITPGCHDREY